jgi:hypothetical protein
MAVVSPNLVKGATEGLTLWLYADPFYPHNIPGAMEGVGFGAMAVSFLIASQVFGGDKLQQWARWVFLGTGLSALVVFTDPLVPLPLVLVFADLIAGFILLTAAPVLLVG